MKLSARDTTEIQLKSDKIKFVAEYKFHPDRKWRFDFALPEYKIAVEIEGGHMGRVVICDKCKSKVGRWLKSGKYIHIREGGRHNSITGMRKDCEKYNAAAGLGWLVLRYTSDMVYSNPGQVSDDVKGLIIKQYGR